jgi:hypothetical protein
MIMSKDRIREICKEEGLTAAETEICIIDAEEANVPIYLMSEKHVKKAVRYAKNDFQHGRPLMPISKLEY